MALTAKIQVGSGEPLLPIIASSAQAAFNDAIKALPPTGGELHVLPCELTQGDIEYYQIESPVAVKKPNVHIRCAPGVVFRFRSPVGGQSAAANMFEISSPNFRLSGARFEKERGSMSADLADPSDQSFIRLLDGAHSATIENCFFHLNSENSALKNFYCINGIGTPSAASRRATSLLNNEVEFLSVEQAAASSGTDVFGGGFFRTSNSTHTHIVGNSFFGGPVPPPASGSGGCLIVLDGDRYSLIQGNTARLMHLKDSQGQGNPAILLTNAAGGEGHHVNISGNYFEDVAASHIVDILGCHYVNVVNNNFGRIDCHSVVHTDSTPGSKGNGTSLLASANAFHNVVGKPGNSLHLRNISNVLVEGNMFTLIQKGKVPIVIGSGVKNDKVLKKNQLFGYAPGVEEFPPIRRGKKSGSHQVRP